MVNMLNGLPTLNVNTHQLGKCFLIEKLGNMNMLTKQNDLDSFAKELAFKELEEKYTTLVKNYDIRGEALSKANKKIAEFEKLQLDRSLYISSLLEIESIIDNLNLI